MPLLKDTSTHLSLTSAGEGGFNQCVQKTVRHTQQWNGASESGALEVCAVFLRWQRNSACPMKQQTDDRPRPVTCNRQANEGKNVSEALCGEKSCF